MSQTPGQAARKLRLAALAIKRERDWLLARTGDRAMREATQLSRGRLTAAQRRKLDYPYATRHGGTRVSGDPAIINIGRGEFLASWRLERHGSLVLVINNSDVAGYLRRGTSKMIARPIEERIVERVVHEFRLDGIEALSRALRVLGR